MSDEQPCVMVHVVDPDRFRKRAPNGFLVCTGCLENLRETVAELATLHEELVEVLKPTAGSGQKVRTSQSHPLPIDPRVAAHRSRMQDVLASWCSMVAEERGYHPPAHPRIDATVPFLLRHHDWACCQPWIDEYAAELRELRGRAFGLLQPNGRRYIDLGPCVELVTVAGPRCAGPCPHVTCQPTMPCPGWITATLHPADTLLPAAINCDHAIAHCWESPEWLKLGKRLKGVA